MMPGLSSGTAKAITEITEDRIILTHHPCSFVSVYVDPRQDADAMDKEGDWIKNRILQGEKSIKMWKELTKTAKADNSTTGIWIDNYFNHTYDRMIFLEEFYKEHK